jgi:xylan 1,4-beta-xylosidase
MRRSVDEVRSQIAASDFPSLPLHYSEWNVSPIHEDRFGKDSEFTATFALQTLKDMENDLASYSWWTVSDIFEESGPGLAPFTGKYGLCNLHGIMKPVGHAFRFLSRLQSEEIETPDSSLIVTRDAGAGRVTLLAWNHVEPVTVDFYGGDWEVPEENRSLFLQLEGLSGRWRERHWLVDRNHGNGFRAWQEAGQPSHLTRKEVERLKSNAEAPCVVDSIREAVDSNLMLSAELSSNAFRLIELERLP